MAVLFFKKKTTIVNFFLAGLIFSYISACGGGTDNTATPTSTTFPSGNAEYSFEDSTLQGWTADGLWHVTDKRASNGSYSAWYADPASQTFETFDNSTPQSNIANSGSMTSPDITLGANPTLTFDYMLDNECQDQSNNYICVYDTLTVEVSKNNGIDYIRVAMLPQTVKGFNNFKVDLYRFAGMTVSIRFHFDTLDNTANNFEGAYIDNIIIANHTNLVTDSFPLTLISGTDFPIEALTIPLHFPFPFQGDHFTDVSVNTYGYLDFGGAALKSTPNVSNFLNDTPRIAMLWHDMNPENGGSINVQRTLSSVIVTFFEVKSNANKQTNNFSAELRSDGTINLTYGNLGALTALVGITPGGGSADPQETDLSINPSLSASGVSYENFTGGGTDDVDLSNTTVTFN